MSSAGYGSSTAIRELPKVVKYIDIPLQHADDAMLRAMRRERSGAALVKLLARIRARIPGVVLRTSFIVGFPGETDAAFQRLQDFVRDEKFDRVGVFTYSREENTSAYDMANQVPERVKRARRAELMTTQSEISLAKNRDLVGREMEVLVEGPMPGRASSLRGRTLRGRTPGQAPEIDGSVFLAGDAQPGEFVRARIDKALSYDLHATVADAIA